MNVAISFKIVAMSIVSKKVLKTIVIKITVNIIVTTLFIHIDDRFS